MDLIQKEISLIEDKQIITSRLRNILDGGVKEDFYKIAALLKKYSIDEMIRFYKEKYDDRMMLISIPSALVYFDIADKSDDPISLNGQTWEQIKKELRAKVREFLS
jgi:hypothetical protein